MGWGNILGTVGGIASGAGGLIGGDVGGILQGIGAAGSLAGSAIAGNQAQALQGQATQAQTQATGAALDLARAQDKRAAQSYQKAMGIIPQGQAAYAAEEAALGPAPQMDPNAVAARASQLMPEYMKEADQQMQVMSSTDIGNLMKAGMDTSTFGVQTRGMLAAKGADLHQIAYNKAYQDALDYVSKLTQGQTATRDAALKETMTPYTYATGAYEDLYGKTPSSADTLKTGILGAEDLSKSAAVGASAAQQGAAQSNLDKAGSNFLSAVKDIWGNTVGSNDASWSTKIDPYVYSSGTAATTASGRDY